MRRHWYQCLWINSVCFIFQTFLRVVFQMSFSLLVMSCLMFEGDVYSEEILFLSGLLPREVTWRFLLSYWGTHSCTTSKAALCGTLQLFCVLICVACAVCFSIGGWRWWQRLVRLWWNRWAERCSGWTVLHAHRRDLWTQRKWAVHCCDFTHGCFWVHLSDQVSSVFPLSV